MATDSVVDEGRQLSIAADQTEIIPAESVRIPVCYISASQEIMVAF